MAKKKCDVRKDCIPYQDGISECDKCFYPKRKSKVRRIKAWAFVFMGKTGRVLIDAYSDRNISHKGLRPCTILIDEKYMKEKP